LGPFRPYLAGMIEAGIVMDSEAMTFDDAQLRRLCPELSLRTTDQVIEKLFAVNLAA
jgi:hypothetical protein